MLISSTSPESLQCYRRWWQYKYMEDGRRIERVKWHGPISGVYGHVSLILDDGSEIILSAYARYRPRKTDIVVYDRPPENGSY